MFLLSVSAGGFSTFSTFSFFGRPGFLFSVSATVLILLIEMLSSFSATVSTSVYFSTVSCVSSTTGISEIIFII